MQLRFQDFLLDTKRFELVGADGPVTLQPRALQLLIMLAERPGELVTKDQIIDQIWEGRAVGDSALATQVKALRRVLGENGRPYRIIGTVHGRGYRFIAPVEQVRSAATAQSEAQEPEEQNRLGEAPSLAVLPFHLLGTAGPHSGLAEALPDEIITSIARLRWIEVKARGSSFQFPSVMSDPGSVREALSVGYVLSGTIEPFESRIAVSVELADADAERVLWSERFELPISDIHALRRQIVDKAVQAVDSKIPMRESERARFKPPEHLTAWERYHFGVSNIFSFGRPDYRAGLEHFSAAIAIEPSFARAHAGLSHIHWWQMVQQASEASDETRLAMFDSATRAIEADPSDPFANLVAGRTAWLRGDRNGAEDWLKRSVSFAPSYAMAHGALANFLTLSGREDDALPHVDKAIDLSPVDPWLHNMLAIKSAVLIQQGDYEAAADWAAKAMLRPHDSLITAHCSLVAMHAAGRTAEAKRIADKLKIAKPDANSTMLRRSLPIFSGNFNREIDEAFAAYGIK